MHKCHPYIGITGFMSAREMESILKVVPSDADHLFMQGVLVSEKTLNGQKNKWPGRYPLVENVKQIFVSHPLVLRLVHYNADDKTTLLQQIERVVKVCSGKLDGFQLNMTWPSPKVLDEFFLLHEYPNGFKIVLQVGQKALDMVENSPKKLADKALDYRGLIDYILIDPSGGLGKPFDTEKARDYLRALRDLGFCGLGVAGGLSPTTLNLVEPLVEEFPYLSIDAEGRLRTPQPKDALNLEVAKDYVDKAFAIFAKNRN